MKTKAIVEKILKEKPSTRDNDKELCYWVWNEICKAEGHALFMPFALFKKLPAFETISRSRRKIQNEENKLNDRVEEPNVFYNPQIDVFQRTSPNSKIIISK